MSTGPTGPTLRSSNKNTGDTFEQEDQEDQEDQDQEDQEDQEEQGIKEYQAAVRISSFIERRIALGRRRRTTTTTITMATVNKAIKGYFEGNPISDDDEAWRQLLISLQFNEETSEEMFCQGITSPKDLVELDNEYLKHFNKTIKSSPHPDADPKKLFIGIKVRQNLDTLKVWIELHDLCNQSYLPAAWTVTSLDETKERIKELSAIKKSCADDNLKDPEVLKDINSWEPFEELLMSYLRTARGACNVPLAYIVQMEATSDTADFNAVYVDEDERYIRCTKHKGSHYSADNRRMW
jgi:hypothetical protein